MMQKSTKNYHSSTTAPSTSWTWKMLLILNDSAGVKLIIIDVLFFSLATVAVGLRTWSRRLKRCPLALNDYAVVVGLVRGVKILARLQVHPLNIQQLLTAGLAATEIAGTYTAVLILDFSLSEPDSHQLGKCG